MQHRDHLILYVNGIRHEIRGEQAFRSLSDFLRYDLGLVGTKIVCAEGDCGSCSVFVGRLDPSSSDIRYETVCSCIQFLCQLDCTHIITVEGLKYDERLNPVQEAMVACQGSQCGFCTPGFIVSMCAMFEDGAKAKRTPADVQKACVGNLCRCTGYEAILRAGANVDPAAMRSVGQLYPDQKLASDFREHQGQSVIVKDGGRAFCKPTSIVEACRFRAENPDCTVVAGATDIGVQVNK